jgi:general secretion pathway protein G
MRYPIRRPRARPGEGEEGWTLVETLIVIAIILILMGAVIIVGGRAFSQANGAQAKATIGSLATALEIYRNDCASYPATDQGLKALYEKPTLAPSPAGWSGPYIQKALGKDPWGREYEYRCPGSNGRSYEIRSFGSDGLEGGEGDAKDIASWD